MSLLTLFLVSLPWVAPQDTGVVDTFSSGGCNIRYVTVGKGEAVVLVHGWMGDASNWGSDSAGNPQLKPAEGFQIIALDCRGHGKSGKPHDPDQYGTEMAEDVVRLLDHLKIEKAHLIGYSSGAFIIGKVAAAHPQRVRSLVYAAQAPVLAPAKAADFSECALFAKTVEEGGDLGKYLIAITPAGRPKPTEAQAKALAKFLYGNKDVKAFAAAGVSFNRLEVKVEDLKKCSAPVLFIHGGNESNYIRKRVAAVHGELGRGHLKIIEGGDHITTLAKPEFGKAILSFLRTGSPD